MIIILIIIFIIISILIISSLLLLLLLLLLPVLIFTGTAPRRASTSSGRKISLPDRVATYAGMDLVAKQLGPQ